MKLAGKKAVSSPLIVLIILGSIVGVLGIFYVYGQTQGCFGCTGDRIMEVPSVTFNATRATLDFSVINPFPSQQAVSSVIISAPTLHQISCDANFAPLKANAVTSESCTVSGVATVSKGETVSYVVYFANSQESSGSIQAD